MNRILAAIALTLLLACPLQAQELQGTLQKIKASGTITIGFREQSVPFSFLGTDGKPTGYSIDLCQRVVAGLQQQLGLSKLDVKWVAVTPDTRIPALVQGTIDLECGSTTNTLSRQEQVDFSHMTFVDGGALSEQYLSYEPYGLMVRRGDAPFRLGVNRVLSYLYRSGEIAQIYARWFGKLGAPSNLLLAMYALHALPE